MSAGRVYLVGAGPGDPKLLTLRGAEALRSADVVVYDRLAPDQILDLAPTSAERIYAGKKPGNPTLDQDAINDLIVGLAREGKTVVRLKGGDPFVFGRGGEELLACVRAGVPCEVIPGVTAAVAAPATIGVPLTHRGLSSSVAFVTARATSGAEPNLTALARAADTLVVLMVAGNLDATCRVLLEAGRPPTEPAALVQWATTARQRSVISTLGDLPAAGKAAGIGPPATLVAGPVVGIAAELQSVVDLHAESTPC